MTCTHWTYYFKTSGNVGVWCAQAMTKLVQKYTCSTTVIFYIQDYTVTVYYIGKI